ncbi:hypothetical protein O181_045628 [Austropuccinia psidii MF-1]|uniref:Reverse transcriptase/retrotransposon-derived protein RNase H-like domain-containing protein n=1 Tax=Austropuccinia psidii MF-1 TaxID=1389203 RepID=A0A9Q3HHS3_9BASI|nr:hypothetical protein [Austropuccinia psidii MF-1]
MTQVWNTWDMLFQAMTSRCILKTFSKSSIGDSPRAPKLFNPFLCFPIYIVVSLKITLKITALTSLLKKDSPFIFNEESLSQFQILKEAFETAPILSHFNPSLPTIVETDASYYALVAVLSQVNDLENHPIAFDSCKLLPAELNYEIHDKEILCITILLSSISCPPKFLLVVRPIGLNFTIAYCPGRLATLPDALSCQEDVYPERGVDFIRKNPQDFHQVIKQDGIQESRFFSIKVEIFSDLVEQNQKEVWQDKDYREILKQLARVQQVVKEELVSEISIFKKYADRNRTITPYFQPVDKVLLASKSIKTTRPTKKLSERFLVPLKVFKNIRSHAYHLKFPLKWKTVQPVFHVSLLELVKQSSIQQQNQFPPPPIIVEEQEEWEVAQDLD